MLRSLVAAGLVGLAPLPAVADGQFSWSWTPQTRQETQALRTGLALYARAHDLRDADLRQEGDGNRARIAQSGGRNLAIVRQEGEGNAASLTQRGGRNAFALIQRGRGNEATVAQSGNRSGVLFQFGW